MTLTGENADPTQSDSIRIFDPDFCSCRKLLQNVGWTTSFGRPAQRIHSLSTINVNRTRAQITRRSRSLLPETDKLCFYFPANTYMPALLLELTIVNMGRFVSQACEPQLLA